MPSIAAPVRLIAVAIFAMVVSACDHGGAFIAENKTDQELIARVTGMEQVAGSSTLSFEPRQDVLLLPAQSRLAIAILEFHDPFDIHKIEILTADCAPVGVFAESGDVAFARDGQVIIIDPGPTASLRNEFPATGTLASATERCRDLSGQ